MSTLSRLALSSLLLGSALLPAQILPSASWTPVSETSTPQPDYSQKKYWMFMPQRANTHPVDVLFFHTTTFKDPNYVDPTTGAYLATPRDLSKPPVWNQPIADAILDTAGTAITNTQVSVFAASCNIYAPFYRQAALPEALWPDPAASERALSVAYSDIEAAFDYYLTHLNRGRPFILAGHSQGSNLLLWLLERRFNNMLLRRAMVAAYVVGWAITKDEITRFPHLNLCDTSTETGCIVTFNTQGPSAATSLARPGAIGVNPLLSSRATSGDTAPKSAHLGAVLMPPLVPTQVELPHFSGAYLLNGALVLTDPPTTAPMANASRVYHPFDYAIFYRNLEQNAKDRIRAFFGDMIRPH